MWNPQGIYSQYVLKTPLFLIGRESIRELYNYPCARIAVIHGTSISDEGLFKETFQKKDIRFFRRSWAGEPDVDNLSATLHEIEKFKPDTLIAIGGGSTIDGVKLCRIFLEAPYYRPGVARIDNGLFTTKFIAIPTTVGSGAEVSSAAVYIDKESGSKQMAVMHELLPDVVVYDDRYVMNTPTKLLCESVMDALAHIVEGYVSRIENRMAEVMAECGLSILKTELDKLLSDKYEGVDFDRLQYVGQIGGIVQNHCIVGAAHAVAHQLAPFGFSHGEAVALLLPEVIKLNIEDESTRDKYEKIAKHSGFRNVDEVIDFINSICHLGNIDRRKGELAELLMEKITDRAFVNSIKNDRGGKGNPIEITDEYIDRLIRSI